MPLLAQQAPLNLTAPEAPPAAPGSLKGVLEDTRRNWPLVLFHILILGGSVGYAATATAEPIEAAGLTPELVKSVAGDPWATVVVALLFFGSQFIAAWDRSSKARSAELEVAKARIGLLEKEALEKAKEIAKLEAKAELAMLREGDARAAVSGVIGRQEVG